VTEKSGLWLFSPLDRTPRFFFFFQKGVKHLYRKEQNLVVDRSTLSRWIETYVEACRLIGMARK
jgi:hypothetical protein